ncbi:hypothetical protein AB0I28_32150 [Phytomonospora sp. NPDC050363]|uniref:hypothetical protein n=1 Tax=Phytomonospora sp. NPDC050363 TaxID=3155642 RepID=UPI0033F86603
MSPAPPHPPTTPMLIPRNHSGGNLPQLFGPAFEADPGPTYDALRAAGPVAWAELSPAVCGMLVTGYDAAVELLNAPTGGTWTRDTRLWKDLQEGRVPPDSPVSGIYGWQPGVLFAEGPTHQRLRAAISQSMARMPHHRLRDITRSVSLRLIETMSLHGRADLVSQYAMLIPLTVFTELLACPPETSRTMIDACAALVDAGPEAARGAALFASTLVDIVATRQETPGDDLPTWLLQHPARLTPEEVVSCLYAVFGGGNVPTAAWIAQALRHLLSDPDFASDVASGTVPVRAALHYTLWTASPVGNFTFYIPTRDTRLHGVAVTAGTLVVVSHHAVNTDPRHPDDLPYDSRAHLAFSAGEHRCPAPAEATVICETAVTTILDALWDLRITDTRPAPNKPGLFHQCPQHLNVTFTPTPKEPQP